MDNKTRSDYEHDIQATAWALYNIMCKILEDYSVADMMLFVSQEKDFPEHHESMVETEMMVDAISQGYGVDSEMVENDVMVALSAYIPHISKVVGPDETNSAQVLH